MAMKRERRKVHHSQNITAPHQSSSIVTIDCRPQPLESWKPKSYALSEDGDSEPVYISSGRSTPEPPPPTASLAQVGVKRKRHHHGTLPGSGGGGNVKKQKRSSVESRTVSVTRVSMPVYDSSSAEELDTSRDLSECETSISSDHGLSSLKEEEKDIPHEKRPRSLRVSLSIPDEVEPGTPFDKVMKVHYQRVTSVETKELPSWENFENSNLLHRASSPKQRPQTLATEKSGTLFPKSNTAVKAAPEAVVTVASSKNAPAFLASPLPILSTPKLSHPSAPAVTTPSAPGGDVKASVDNSSSASSCFDVGVKPQGASSLSTSPPGPAAVDVGYSAPTDVAVTTRPVVKAAQPEVKDLTPSSQPPQRSPHPLSQPQAQPTDLPKPTSTTTATPATPPGITQPSIASPLSPTSKPAAFPTEPAAPNPKHVPVPMHVPGQQQPQQRSVLVPHQHQPSPTPVSPKSNAQHVLVAQQQQKQPIQQQQQLSSAPPAMLKTPSVQQVSNVPVHAHQSLTAASSTQSPSVAGQQIMVATSSRPSSVPVQRPVVANSQVIVNSQRPPNVPIQQQVPSRPSSSVSAVSQPHHQQQQQVYIASTRPASIPGQQQQQQQVIVSAARPSTVPIQQHRPLSVPTQQQQTVVVAPPRPSSVPISQPIQSHSQSQSPLTTPTQRVRLVTYSQNGAPVQQVVVTQPPAYVGKAQPTTVFQASASTPTSVLTRASPANVQYSNPTVQMQRQIQEQNIAAARKTALQSSGDADVIITGVESTNRGVNQVPSVGYHAAVTQGGERLVILNTTSGEAIPYQTTALSTSMGPGAVRKVMPKTVVSYLS